jgi:EmrB/QacA subfamily drug resistance transporter
VSGTARPGDRAAVTDTTPPPPTGHRRWWIFATVGLALFMASIDQTIVATALPTLQHDLHATVNWSSWTITVYSLGQVIAMPTAGRLSDLYGRKLVFVSAIVLFTVTSLGCALVDKVYVLVVLRACQALGGGAFMPSATGIVADEFGRDRDRAIGFFASIFPIGGVIGPVLGGVFVTYWSWRGIFLVNVPIGAVLVVLSLALIAHTRVRTEARVDVVGVALLAGLLLAAMVGIAQLGRGSVSVVDPVFWAPELGAIVLAVLFVRHAGRARTPVVPIMLLRARGFAVMNLLNFMVGSAALGFGALIPLYAQQRYGISALSSSTLLTGRAIATFVVASLAVLAMRRTGYRLPMAIGSLVVAVGTALTALAPVQDAYLWLAAGTAVTGLGMGCSIPSTNNAALNMAPEQASAVSGLRGMFRQGGSITSVSITSAIIARSADPGVAQGHVFAVFAVLMVATVPLAFLVPDHHGSW